MAKGARKVGRTYNLERAVRDLARALRDDLHTEIWARAGQDPEFQPEVQEIWLGWEADDRLAWGDGAG